VTTFGLLMSGAGLVLLYAGIKGEDPRTIVTDVLTGKRRLAPGKTDTGRSRNDAGINNGTTGELPVPPQTLGAAAGAAFAGYGSPAATTAYSPLSPLNPPAID
jgi:hypothetical protein